MVMVPYESIQLASRHHLALERRWGQPKVKMGFLFKGVSVTLRNGQKLPKIAGILTYKVDYFKTKIK